VDNSLFASLTGKRQKSATSPKWLLPKRLANGWPIAFIEVHAENVQALEAGWVEGIKCRFGSSVPYIPKKMQLPANPPTRNEIVDEKPFS
jgi:hypothetical protein